MGRKKKAGPDWTPAERRAARKLVLYPVQCRHVDPSLLGDGSDQWIVGFGRTYEEARAGARALEASDPDSWNCYEPRGGVDLMTYAQDRRIDPLRLYRRILRARPGFIRL